MAIIKKGILGGFSNKVGNVVGSTWKGINTMRSLPAQYNDANSVAQQANRSTFKYFSGFGSQLLTGIIRPLWDWQAKRMSGYNLFIKRNIDYRNANEDTWSIEDLIISQGRLCQAEGINSAVNLENNLQLNIISDLQCSIGEQSDEIFVAIFDHDEKLLYAGMVGDRGELQADGRYLLRAEITCPQVKGHPELNVYIAARNSRLKEVSNNTYYYVTGLEWEE